MRKRRKDLYRKHRRLKRMIEQKLGQRLVAVQRKDLNPITLDELIKVVKELRNKHYAWWIDEAPNDPQFELRLPAPGGIPDYPLRFLCTAPLIVHKPPYVPVML